MKIDKKRETNDISAHQIESWINVRNTSAYLSGLTRQSVLSVNNTTAFVSAFGRESGFDFVGSVAELKINCNAFKFESSYKRVHDVYSFKKIGNLRSKDILTNVDSFKEIGNLRLEDILTGAESIDILRDHKKIKTIYTRPQAIVLEINKANDASTVGKIDAHINAEPTKGRSFWYWPDNDDLEELKGATSRFEEVLRTPEYKDNFPKDFKINGNIIKRFINMTMPITEPDKTIRPCGYLDDDHKTFVDAKSNHHKINFKFATGFSQTIQVLSAGGRTFIFGGKSTHHFQINRNSYVHKSDIIHTNHLLITGPSFQHFKGLKNADSGDKKNQLCDYFTNEENPLPTLNERVSVINRYESTFLSETVDLKDDGNIRDFIQGIAQVHTQDGNNNKHTEIVIKSPEIRIESVPQQSYDDKWHDRKDFKSRIWVTEKEVVMGLKLQDGKESCINLNSNGCMMKFGEKFLEINESNIKINSKIVNVNSRWFLFM